MSRWHVVLERFVVHTGAVVVLSLAAVQPSCTDVSGHLDPSPTRPGPTFEADAHRTRCPEALSTEAECWLITFRNVGTATGDGSCDLRPRGLSNVRVLDGARRLLSFRNAAPGALDETVTIAVRPGKREAYFFPSIYCSPGPVA